MEIEPSTRIKGESNMIVNQIIKLGLESRTAELKMKGESERSIALILSTESNCIISQPCVHRYLASHDRICQEAVEKSNKLKAKVAELELDTVQARQELIREIRDLAQQAKEEGDLKTALIGLDELPPPKGRRYPVASDSY